MSYLAGMAGRDERNDPGVPLTRYIEQHPGCTVEFHCRGCQFRRSVPIPRVVARLKARGWGDETTGIVAIGGLSDQPCERCGQVNWMTRPGFPPAKMG